MSATQIFHTEGRRWLNQVINGAVALPTNLYLGLRTLDGQSTHPADAAAADSLGNATVLAECTATGYSRKTITRNTTNFVESASGADSLLTVAAQTFNFTGAQNGLTHAFLATTVDNTGKLIASAPLGATRNVISGDSLAETFVFTLTQG